MRCAAAVVRVTCSAIETAGKAARAIGASLLATLSVSDFTDCVDQLGEIDTWSVEQLAVLGKLAKAVSEHSHVSLYVI